MVLPVERVLGIPGTHSDCYIYTPFFESSEMRPQTNEQLEIMQEVAAEY